MIINGAKHRGKTVAGEFIAANLNTPTDILYGFIEAEEVIQVIQRAIDNGFPYTHVGFSIFIAAYSKFVECANAVKKIDNSIVTIVGNAGLCLARRNMWIMYAKVMESRFCESYWVRNI